ncbi:hypothetical protein [Actinoplanes teichomyceticus]|uniref:Uncharacterized protein n=1 Tax=Actinoplanes teichomyceticus TaxID=1867 RepID=A0A561WI91_ACTTI|nr:hypothetical protein [Actinoplanes teichomyceticus]TWG23581.1 hypothetical protein FHX34_102130 [Actinoplanes teichomyceticus]GIF16207.1 hypothetical protein Ate01nite_62390 [Actinoplanes teichomyceticus]
MSSVRQCAICGTDEAETWTPVVLLETLRMRCTVLNDADVPPIPAGLYWLCPPCESWRPEARTAPLPARVMATVNATAALIEKPDTRHLFHTEQVGAYRHFARQLQAINYQKGKP